MKSEYLEKLSRNWDHFGKNDPFWAILTEPEKKGGKWDITEFFESGVREMDHILRHCDTLGIQVKKNAALDFGCGAGRLSQALCRDFEQVYGVDIAPSMIKLANKYNKNENKCKYILNIGHDLPDFQECFFDFIYSNITLQHISPIYVKKYIREFFRVLKPGGCLIFQMPSRPLDGNFEILYSPESTSPYMEMNAIPKDEMAEFIKIEGGRLLNAFPNCVPGWESYGYCVQKI